MRLFKKNSTELLESRCRLGKTCRWRPAHAGETALASADASGSGEQATGGQLPAIGSHQQLQQDSSVSPDFSHEGNAWRLRMCEHAGAGDPRAVIDISNTLLVIHEAMECPWLLR